MHGWAFVFAWVLAQLVSGVVAAWDKRRARRGQRRVSERGLLALAFTGGVGMGLAFQWTRHKTRKQPFRRRFHGVRAAGVLTWVAVFAACSWEQPFHGA